LAQVQAVRGLQVLVTLARRLQPNSAMRRSQRFGWVELTVSALLACSSACRNEPARSNTSATPVSAGALRAPDVPYEPSPEHVVTEIIRLARLAPGDVLYDLGCGDGRIVIAAVRTHGVRGACVDIDPQRIAESRENARRAGVDDRIEFITQDLFETDLRPATVVTLFLWPKINLKLRPKLSSELEPGTRVISYMHDMGDWQPDESVPVHSGTRDTAVYLWTIPERAGAAAVRK
jgi:SAM-dependent methyltransferase